MSSKASSAMVKVKSVVIWSAVGLVTANILVFTLSFRQLYRDVKVLIKPKTKAEEEKKEDTYQESRREPPLFRICPVTRGRLPWKDFGQKYPTPLHVVKVNNVRITFKREDLISDRYGGNKVRTLEFLLPSVSMQLGKENHLHVLGGSGSNQCVATAVYAPDVGISRERVESLAIEPEEPSHSNFWNLISMKALSKLRLPAFGVNKMWWTVRFLYKLWLTNDKFLPIGGYHILGVLGQVGGILELAEQIHEGKTKDPTDIFLPWGSGCTTAGLLVGIAFARKISFGFRRPLEEFTLHSVVVHPKIAQWPHFMLDWWLRSTATAVHNLLKDLGCEDFSKELDDVFKQLKIVKHHAGKYGGHTPASEKASKALGQCQVEGPEEETIKSLWFCSTFSGKAAAALMEHLDTPGRSEDIIFWQTKSVVQPRLSDGEEEIEKVLRGLNSEKLNDWMDKGKTAKRYSMEPFTNIVNLRDKQ